MAQFSPHVAYNGPYHDLSSGNQVYHLYFYVSPSPIFSSFSPIYPTFAFSVHPTLLKFMSPRAGFLCTFYLYQESIKKVYNCSILFSRPAPLAKVNLVSCVYGAVYFQASRKKLGQNCDSCIKNIQYTLGTHFSDLLLSHNYGFWKPLDSARSKNQK